MNFQAAALLSCAIFGATASATDNNVAEPYLYDLLKIPAYHRSWSAMFIGEKEVDAWLAKYAKTKDGPTAPEPPIQLAQARYSTHMVCKAHDCGANRFFVMFAPGGSKAWGILLRSKKPELFFGHPDDEKKKALRTAAHVQ